MAQATSVKSTAPKRQPAVERTTQFQERRSDQSGRYDNLLALQRAAGNHAISQTLQSSIKSPAPNGDGIPPIVRSVINRGSGQPLDPSIRADMESRFGEDFGQVRVHTDTRAADSAEAVSAKAYTVGRDVVFGEGRYPPDTREGKGVSAHELAHVVQQSRGGAAPALDPGSPLEQAADQAATGISEGYSAVNVSGSSGIGLARDKKSFGFFPYSLQ